MHGSEAETRQNFVNEVTDKQALAIRRFGKVPGFDETNGNHTVVKTDDLPIAKYVTDEQLRAEEKFLAEQEADVEKRYAGVRGYLRIAHVSGVIGKLALYLYLDQHEVHQKAQLKYAKERLRKAERM